MTELEVSLISGVASLVEQIVTSIIASTSMTDAQKSAALTALGAKLDATAAKVAAVKFRSP